MFFLAITCTVSRFAVASQILKELSEVEAALVARGAPSTGLAAPRAYTSALALYTVGALRRYHSCLLRNYISSYILCEINQLHIIDSSVPWRSNYSVDFKLSLCTEMTNYVNIIKKSWNGTRLGPIMPQRLCNVSLLRQGLKIDLSNIVFYIYAAFNITHLLRR